MATRVGLTGHLNDIKAVSYSAVSGEAHLTNYGKRRVSCGCRSQRTPEIIDKQYDRK